MTTNKKRPSDFVTVWDGNLDSVIHTHRPGNSQKASIRQIVDAAVSAVVIPGQAPDTPAVEWTGETTALIELDNVGTKQQLTVQEIIDSAAAAVVIPVNTSGTLQAGDILLKRFGTYADFLECNGSIHANAEAPALAALIGHNEIVGYSADSENRYVSPTGVTGLLAVERMNGYTVYLSSVSPFVVLVDATGAVLYSMTVNNTLTKLVKTANAIYAMNVTAYGAIFAFTGLKQGSPVIPSTYFYKGVGGAPIINIATASNNFDVMFSALTYSQYYVDLRTMVVGAITNVAAMSNLGAIAGAANSRCFVICRADGVYGIYEFVVNEAAKTAELNLIYEDTTHTVLISSANSPKIYFGYFKPQYSYDTTTGVIETISTPQTSGVTTLVGSAYKNVLWVNSDPTLNKYSYISFDAGKTWKSAQYMHTTTRYVTFSGDVMISIGDNGAGNSTKSTTGNVQTNALVKVSSDNFVAPDLKSVEEGYKYYVKK